MADLGDYQGLASGLNSFVENFIQGYRDSAKRNEETERAKELLAQKMADAEAARKARAEEREADRLFRTEQSEADRNLRRDLAARDEALRLSIQEKRLSGQKSPDEKLAETGKVFERATGLRKEFQALPEVKQVADVVNSYEKMEIAAQNPSAAGDISMIFNFMKLQDPGSTVREGEYANAQNAAGIPDQIRNVYNKAINGSRLNSSQRQDFLNQARNNMSVHLDRAENAAQKYEQLSQEYQVPSKLVVGQEQFSKYRQPKKTTGPSQTSAYQSMDENSLMAEILKRRKELGQ